MKYRPLILIAISSLATLIPLGVTFAKGTPDRVAIAGPDWFGEIEVLDPVLLEHLAPGVFEDLENPAQRMDGLQRGYLLTRGYVQEDVFQPWDRVLYFADPNGGRGLVYYLEIIDGAGPSDGRWYHASEAGEAAMQEILFENAVRPPEQDPEVGVESGTGLAAAGGLLLFLFGAAAGYLGSRWQTVRARSRN